MCRYIDRLSKRDYLGGKGLLCEKTDFEKENLRNTLLHFFFFLAHASLLFTAVDTLTLDWG